MDVKNKIQSRRSLRLRDFDYASPRAYFVTICTAGRACILSSVIDDRVVLTEIGVKIHECWVANAVAFGNDKVDAFVVMPNQVHGILWLKTGAMNRAPTLGDVVRSFKARAAREVNAMKNGITLWQRNYHDRVIRDDRELNNVRQYVLDNPSNWCRDCENPLRP